MYVVIRDVAGDDARTVSPPLTTGNDVLDPVGWAEVTRQPTEVKVEYLEEDFSVFLWLVTASVEDAATFCVRRISMWIVW